MPTPTWLPNTLIALLPAVLPNKPLPIGWLTNEDTVELDGSVNKLVTLVTTEFESGLKNILFDCGTRGVLNTG
jgi:hypothetical protein